MQDNELLDIWKSVDKKLEQTLIVNQQLTEEVSKLKINNLLSKTKTAKQIALFIAFPYIILLLFIAMVAFKIKAYLVFAGFFMIAIINIVVVISYIYHLSLINKIDNSLTVSEVQENVSRLKLSSFKSLKMAFLQLPFWCMCFMSIDVFKKSPWLYGGSNILICLLLTYFAVWLYKNMDYNKMDKGINRFLFSGFEWGPIMKSTAILEQLKEARISL